MKTTPKNPQTPSSESPSTPSCASSDSKDKERTAFFAEMFGDSNIRKESLHLVQSLKHQYAKGSRLYVLVLSISGLAQPIAWWSRRSLEEQMERAMQTNLAAGSFGYALFDATKNGQFSLVSTRRRSLHNAEVCQPEGGKTL